MKLTIVTFLLCLYSSFYLNAQPPSQIDINPVNYLLNNTETPDEVKINAYYSLACTCVFQNLDIATLFVKKRNEEISKKLSISVITIKTHVFKLYNKLDVKNRTQAAKKVSFLGIQEQRKQL